MKFEKQQGILYRTRRRIDGLGETWKQIMVPKSLRICVMEVAHDSIFGGHLGVQKTKDRIQTNFYWPRMHNDISGFCRFCNVCQKTVDKGTAARAPRGEMPLINTPFKRVAVDFVGPITPASERGHKYILTLVDYATRYPEAVHLKNIDTETVVLELRERLDDTMKIAQEELKRIQAKNKRPYDRGAKRRAFQVGDKVLILLPTDNNKLLLQWHGPFVVERCGNGNNYGVEVNKRIKTYHVNMLKPYFERKSDVKSFGDTATELQETKTIQVSVGIAGNQEGSNAEVHESDSYDDKPSVDEEKLLELGGHGQKETLRDVKLGLGLTNSQEENVWQVWEPTTVCSPMCRRSPTSFNTKSR